MSKEELGSRDHIEANAAVAHQEGVRQQIRERVSSPQPWEQPVSFDLSSEDDASVVSELIDRGDVGEVRDEVELVAGELFELYHPGVEQHPGNSVYDEFMETVLGGDTDYGEWFYFPWGGELVRYPTVGHLRELRTSRNKDLINSREQDRLYDSTVAIFGLSVGNNVAESLLSSGVGGRFIIADMDIIEPTNLNRIRADYTDIGDTKVDYLAKRISKIDPYIDQIHLNDGVNEEVLDGPLAQERPDVIFDEVDDLAAKIALRRYAQREGIPVIMATDVGEKSLIDIERYDLGEVEMFNGRMSPQDIERVARGDIGKRELGAFILEKFVGHENVTERLMQSLMQVGDTLPGWPQLGGAATVGGAISAKAAKDILLEDGEPRVMSGRRVIDL